jgi:dolichol kinase
VRGEPAASDLTYRRELARKALHVGGMAAPLGYAAGVPRATMLFVLGALSVVAVAIEIARTRRAGFARGFERATGPLLRAHERTAWAGATWMLLSFLASVALFPPRVAIAAMTAVALGDASAALVGRAWGRIRIGGSSKSLEGSVACGLTTFLGALWLARLDPAASLVAAVAAAAAEWPARPLDDNLRIALATGSGILLWRLMFS